MAKVIRDYGIGLKYDKFGERLKVYIGFGVRFSVWQRNARYKWLGKFYTRTEVEAEYEREQFGLGYTSFIGVVVTNYN